MTTCTFAIIAYINAPKLGTGAPPCCQCAPGCQFGCNATLVCFNLVMFVVFISFIAAYDHVDYGALVTYPLMVVMAGVAAALLWAKKAHWGAAPSKTYADRSRATGSRKFVSE